MPIVLTRRRTVPALVAALLSISIPACKSDGAGAEPGASASPATFAPLRLVTTPEGQSAGGTANFGFKVLELRADGSMLRDGAPYGTIKNDRIATPDGGAFFFVAPDGTLTMHPGERAEYAKLTTSDTLKGSGKNAITLTIADDGTVTGTRADGSTFPVQGKFDPIPPGGKRAAALVLATTRPGLALWGHDKVP